MSDQDDYDKLRKRVEKRIKARQEFFSHLVTYLMVNAFLWMIWVVTGAGGFPWPIFVRSRTPSKRLRFQARSSISPSRTTKRCRPSRRCSN